MHPTRIGRYEIHSLLGQGGMGTVYRGRDPAMERWVAIKTITVQDVHQRARFQQEVRAAGGLNHPHITTIYDVGEQDELAYIVMELVDGQTLVSRLASPVPWSEAINLLLPICQALAYAHSRGVIHRDVKPANILISVEGQAKLSDFGVARLEAALRRITESGSTVGTPLYTAPEQIRNEPVDGRADLFSLGVVLFELISGQHPFIADTLAQIIFRITQPQPANLDALTPLAPPAVVGLVGRALAKQAAARFGDAAEMAAAMTACLAQPDVFHLPPPPKSLSGTPLVLTTGPVIDLVASNISLSPTEEALLKTAFAGHDRVYLEREFSSGYSGARVLLATPVRSGGRRLAQVVLKLDAPAAIEQEWQAYQKYVKDTLPPVTARILEEPLRAPAGQLALLRYTFAGGLGHSPPESLRTYYAQHEGPEVAALLEKSVFRAFGSKWWLQRKSTDLILRREYDRLLPVQLVVAYRDFNEIMATARNLVAGQVTTHTCSELESGQLVQIQAFRVEEIRPKQNEVTLQAWPPSGSHTNPIRVRVTGLPPSRSEYLVGQVVSSLAGVVTATRREQLFSLAQSAFPNQDLEQQQLTIGGQQYPNPLYDYETLLDQRVSVMHSIIHGDLNLDNILVTPTSGVAWLIDFATTREGHNLYDFMRLETQVITKLIAHTRAGPEAVAHLMIVLHQPETALHQVPTELRQPLLILQVIRRMVRICLYSRDNWDEYYLGLVITLLGALKFKELDPRTRGLVVAAAAAVRSLIELPTLRTVRPAPVVATVSRPIPIRPMIFGAVGLLLLALLSALGFWIFGGQPTPTVEPTSTPLFAAGPKVASAPSSSAASTSTPSPSPTSIVVEVTIPVATVPPPPTATSTSLPTACSPPTFFTDLLKDYLDLGCAVEHWRSDFTVQQFEQGLMVWRKSPDPAEIYILLDQGDWRSYEDPHGPAAPFCPEAQQTGGLGPIFGFGVIWCENESDHLGKPRSKENAFEDSPIEEFAHGLVFELGQATYVLFNDKTWQPWSETVPPPISSNLKEDFTDPAIFHQRWEDFSNGGSIDVGNGYLALTSDNSNSFPYVRLRQRLFPNAGSFAVMVEFQYTQVGDLGAGIVLGLESPENGLPVQSEPDPNIELFKVWQDSSYYQALMVGTSETIMTTLAAPDTNRHTFRYEYQNDLARLYLDGVLVGQQTNRALRPVTLWFGNPYRTPDQGIWSQLRIFSVSVDSLDDSPDIPIKPDGDLILEDFEPYTSVTLRQTYDLNNAWDRNEISIDVTRLPDVIEQGQVLSLNYDIRATTPDNYVGLERTLAITQNWSGFQAIELWVRNDDNSKELVFQWAESQSQSGEVWRAKLLLQPNEIRLIEFPLTPELFQKPDWSPVGNGQIDLDQVSYYAVFIAPAPGESGTICLDSLEALPVVSLPAQATAPLPLPTKSAFQDTGFRPADVFMALWDSLDGGQALLGYPLGGAITTQNYARQPFEHGFMFWWEAPDNPTTWVIDMPDPTAAQGESWNRYQDRWDPTQPAYPPGCLNAVPPLGPRHGFGRTWCEEDGVQSRIGQPIKEEFGSGNAFPKGAFQYFQGGLMFEVPVDRQVWALIEGDGWYRANY
ncbi:MAG: protein kinase [Chloroflexota bacterium]